MSLITCPECGKEISDKSNMCIHCGFPLINTKCIINGIVYDFSEELPIALLQNDEYISAIGAIRRKTSLNLSDGCNLVKIIRETQSIPEKYEPKYPLEDRSIYEDEAPKVIECPYCHSTKTEKIGVIKRSFSFGLLGFGSSKVGKNYHCKACGSDF